MEKKKDELLNFAFNEQDYKLKFYRETLVQMTKEVYQKAKLKDGVIIESIVKEADELTKAIMKKVDEFEQEKTNMWSPNYDPSYNMTTTIIDNGPQYQPNQKPYGTLGEHWKELMDLFDVKAKKGKDWKRYFDKCIDYIFFDTDQFKFVDKKIKSVANILGIEFIIDFVKACEKCEE